jgi:hypothetical protein
MSVGLEEASEEGSGGRIHVWILEENRHPPRSLSSLGGRGDPPTVTQAAPSLGSDSVAVLQQDGDCVFCGAHHTRNVLEPARSRS